jgi:hypothetical protein
MVADSVRRVVIAWQMARQRLLDETGELSSQQVIWIATLATIAVTVGGIIASKVSSAAQSIDLGGAG